MFAVGSFAVLFTWVLLQRYSILRKELTQQALAREKEKTELVEQQKVELEKQVEERTAELKQSIQHLQSTQQQLVHSEKMASLGELTAGIAHEIQNPLNFVNNFSEVNKELVEELRVAVDAGNFEEAKLIAKSIEDNETKVMEHGKRADAIVKNMLQHSRSSSGKKEATDLNALVEEYLRLSYHGLRAKDKAFNAKFETDLDPGIGKIEVKSQDIGRVLLNLINNAFYAVLDKKNLDKPGTYDPIVKVKTERTKDHIIISITDNGNGIPAQIREKIFQPFFTTKPAGQGTGLGLSLSYDIIKAHSGDIRIDTKEGEGSSFIISLPASEHQA
jgi:signal transduction histidine kinase